MTRRAWLALMLGAAVCGLTSRPVAQQVATADEVKAAFIFNFVKFVEWPAEVSSSPAFVIAVLGSDGVEESLRTYVRGKSLNGRDLSIRRVGAGDDLRSVQVLFVGAQEQNRVVDVIRRIDASSVLTVSDAERFCQAGGVIALAMDQNRVRFDVNLDAADRARLKVSSKLLTLARSVHSSKTGDR